MTVTFQTNLDRFNDALADYVSLTRLSTQEAVAKKSADFSMRLSQKLKDIIPGKGTIRSERLAALGNKSEGVKISKLAWKRAYQTSGLVQDLKTRKFGFARRNKVFGFKKAKGGRKLNLQAIAIQKELSVRESGRGFMSFSTRAKSLIQKMPVKDGVNATRFVVSKFSRILTTVGFQTDLDRAEMTFSWGRSQSSKDIAVALQKPRQQASIGQALDESRADMLEYILKRQNRAKAALRSI